MIINNLEESNLSDIPVVIIGSGPAAITFALQLEKKRISCLIIEAGAAKYDHESQQSYKGEVIGDKISDLSHNRLRQFGGTTGHWGGWCKPLEYYNFNNWNINKEDLDKYSSQACKILEIKNEFRNAELDSYFEQIEFQYSSIRFAKKFKDQIEKSKYIKLILNTQVTHFEGDKLI